MIVFEVSSDDVDGHRSKIVEEDRRNGDWRGVYSDRARISSLLVRITIMRTSDEIQLSIFSHISSLWDV